MSRPLVELVAAATSLHGLTLWQPWATAVVDLGKDVENRGKPPPAALVGKPVAIHAGLTYDEAAAQGIREGFGLPVPGKATAPRGAVVGVALLGRSSRNNPSRWAVRGQDHRGLSEVLRLDKPVPCKGAQGFWWLPPPVLSEVKAQLLRESGTASAPPAQPAPPTAAVIMRQCEKCRHWWTGAPGDPHAPRVNLEAGPGWPSCEHGVAFLGDCGGEAVNTGCQQCAQARRAARAVKAGGAS